ncbi:MAG TPA: hypothetical protein VHZ04_02085 [Candidatus Paceibacterota bacterium]|jgi:hypothetical protein|nr:hypothetical protein [Candidatus Paceibacterota bacterium]
MKIWNVAVFVGILFLPATPLQAQQVFSPDSTTESTSRHSSYWARHTYDLPLVECGGSYGRLVSALGYGAECDVNNLFPNTSLYAGINYTHGSSNGPMSDGSEVNFSGTVGGTWYFPVSAPKKIHFGAFGQASFARNRIGALVVTEEGPESFRNFTYTPIYTFGVAVSRDIPHGPRLLFRVGQNFGPNDAAREGNRLFFSVTPLGDVFGFLRHF